MKKVYINGYFTSEYISGVPRYAMEIVKRLDNYFAPGEVVLVIPQNANNIPELKNIDINTWEDRGCKKETTSPLWGKKVYGPFVKSKNGFNVNLSNRAEKVSKSLTCLFDTISLRNDSYDFSLSLRDYIKMKTKQIANNLWFRDKMFIKKKYDSEIVTCSYFSKEDLCMNHGFKSDKVHVIECGWEHIKSGEAFDEKKDSRIKVNEYYFFIGSLYPHKNLKWVLEQAKNMPEALFVIAGRLPYNVVNGFGTELSNIIFLGYVSDEYMKWLMMNCKALLFPSIVEGFGMPPLEALGFGRPAIVADIPVMHEIYSESVHYINPNRVNYDLDILLKEETFNREKVLGKYTWDSAAQKWYELIKKYNI